MPTKRVLNLEKMDIPRERYLELLYFCQQYPLWKEKYRQMHGVSAQSFNQMPRSGGVSTPTENSAEKALDYLDRIELVEQAAREAAGENPKMQGYLLRNICFQIPFQQLDAPCGKNQFSEVRRRFFYALHRVR